MVILVSKKADDVVHAETTVNNHPAYGAVGHAPLILAGLRTAVTNATNREVLDYLIKAYGPDVVKDLLNEVVKTLLPNKTLQCVKRYLRREARKPVDMSVKQFIMHIYCINTEEIARCPPAFDQGQCLSDDEIIDIIFWGTPKSWQCKMDRQGFDQLAKTLTEVVEFMEHIKMSEDFDGNKKVAAVTEKGNKKESP